MWNMLRIYIYFTIKCVVIRVMTQVFIKRKGKKCHGDYTICTVDNFRVTGIQIFGCRRAILQALWI